MSFRPAKGTIPDTTEKELLPTDTVRRVSGLISLYNPNGGSVTYILKHCRGVDKQRIDAGTITTGAIARITYLTPFESNDYLTCTLGGTITTPIDFFIGYERMDGED